MSDASLHRRASELFLRLRDLPATQRSATLAEATADDERLRDEVESLLSYDAGPVDPHRAERNNAAAFVTPHLPERTELQSPERIGPYQIVCRIGRGGSGHVFLATQSEPIERRVAIKIVPQAAIDPELAARFEVERRALERTDHPNIARVLDAGRTVEGLPYLVMDYVEGASITEYCAREELSLKGRIEMMLDVADAIQHAHQRGIIHRDLKPANILVHEVDGRASPIVLDFGISKPLTGTFPIDSPATTGLFLGTPSYMAPEQTGGQNVDTRADVYALGAIMYELASGRPPIQGEGDPVEVMQAIREAVPRPASRVQSSEDSSYRDGVSRAFLTDLDCVLAKALEKRAARRYGNVGAFADDLRRLLRCEPITARPPTLRYRAARFAQRNRALVASGVAIVLALIVAIMGLSLGLVEADKQRRAAMTQREATAAINEFLTEDLLAAASPEERGGRDLTALEMLDRASRRIDLRFPDRPLIAAAVHHTLGESYAALGAFDKAEHHLDRAVELHSESGGPDSSDLLRSQIAAASLLIRRERYQEGIDALEPLQPRARAVLGRDDRDVYIALNDLGVAYQSLGEAERAIALLEQALAGHIRLRGPNDSETLQSMSNLGLAFAEVGDTDRCLELLHEALRIAESLPDESPLTLIGLNANIGVIYQDLKQDVTAAPFLRKAAALAGEFLSEDHPFTLSIEGNLAGLEADLGDPVRAMELYDQVYQKRRSLLGESAESTFAARYGYFDSMRKAGRNADAAAGFQALLADVVAAFGEGFPLVANTRLSITRSLLDSGRGEEARPYAEAAVAQIRASHGSDHRRTQNAQRMLDEINRGRTPERATLPSRR